MNVCIVGGGPAGMMLGFLLARAGVEVDVLEKHKDFFRDFRGDTIHPSTLDLMRELGLLEEFLKQPHQEVREIGANIEGRNFALGDFAHVPTTCKFIALMPQWDFLNFIASHARKLPTFRLRMEHEATELIREGERVVGVRAKTPPGPIEFRADLVVAADGRHSTMRSDAHLEALDFGAPMDVLWMRISRREDDPPDTLGRITQGRFMVMINRQSYWQCAYLIQKGSFDQVRERGLPAFHGEVVAVAPFLSDRIGELKDWESIKLLTVTIDRLKTWHQPGLLCIGDSAHAMSPIGGVGINLAIQDAVAAANLLAAPLRNDTLEEANLAEVQSRREWPTKMTQGFQLRIQETLIKRILGHPEPVRPPLLLRLTNAIPFLRRIPARVVGVGFRPEHVKTPAV